jgi:hypothetical protein
VRQGTRKRLGLLGDLPEKRESTLVFRLMHRAIAVNRARAASIAVQQRY